MHIYMYVDHILHLPLHSSFSNPLPPLLQETVYLRNGVVVRVSHLSMKDKENRSQQFVHALTIAKVLMLASIAE